MYRVHEYCISNEIQGGVYFVVVYVATTVLVTFNLVGACGLAFYFGESYGDLIEKGKHGFWF